MSERAYTGFVETFDGNIILTTIGPVPVSQLMERLGIALDKLPAGESVRVELIAWEGNE